MDYRSIMPEMSENEIGSVWGLKHSFNVCAHFIDLMRSVSSEEVQRAEATLQCCPELIDIFDEKWLKSHLALSARISKHPLFWVLVDLARSVRLRDNLVVLKARCEKFARIVNKLKTNTDYLNFHSVVSEIEVLAYYYGLQSDSYIVEYEPLVPGSTKRPDCKITIDGTEYFLEIFAVFEDEIDSTAHRIQDKIRSLLDSLENNPFILSFGTIHGFLEKDIPGFVEFVQTKIIENMDSKLPVDFEYFIDDQKVADVSLCERDESGGGVGFMHTPARAMNPSIRIKNKILTKVDQLPLGSFNIVVINLAYITQDFTDLFAAFSGQDCVRVNVDTHEVNSGRLPNGLIYHDKGKQISCVIGYVRELYETRRCLINGSAQKVLDKDFVENNL